MSGLIYGKSDNNVEEPAIAWLNNNFAGFIWSHPYILHFNHFIAIHARNYIIHSNIVVYKQEHNACIIYYNSH